MYLFFDTETTGKADFTIPADRAGQPRICQLGAILYDEHGRVRAEINFLVRPDGWTIPGDATRINGITQDMADRYGVSIRGVLSVFERMLRMTEIIVAHNLQFDLFMLEIEVARCPAISLSLPKQPFCTMRNSAEIVRMSAMDRMIKAGRMGFKPPSLQECYRHFFGRDFEGAHDAMADVRACRDVYFALNRPNPSPTMGAAA